VRPEIAAFRELEALVRNLGDQLAGYRRRALSAEGQLRALETDVAALRDERDQLRQSLARAEKSLARAPKAEAKVAAEPPAAELELDADPRIARLQRENHELQELVSQASERAALVVERVRFLRQQMTVEK
jgi:chromosome segregation ATPase